MLRSSLPEIKRESDCAAKETQVIREVCGDGEFEPKRRRVEVAVLMSQRKGPDRSAEEDAKWVLSVVRDRERIG